MQTAARPSSILFTIVGHRDPFSCSRDGQERPGPVLSLLSEKMDFSKIFLVHTPDQKDNALNLSQCVLENYTLEACPMELNIADPTDYEEVLQGLRQVYHESGVNSAESNIYVSMSSGTPQMHSAWLLLTASGEIPARLLQVREGRFAADGRKLVREIDPRARVFPRILPSTTPVTATTAADDEILLKKQALGITGDHPALLETLKQAGKAAPHDVAVMILGENGTGKELLAEFIHRLSTRSEAKFVSVNCAAIPDNMAEAQFFGYKKGAFTGADRDYGGYFMQAHGGTLFLDEVGELPVFIQAKLLRALQQKEFYRMGDTRPTRVDFRLISATNRDMISGMETGEIREDFYFRLNEFNLMLPSLRERKSDIPAICSSFMKKLKAINPDLRISPEAYEAMYEYDWPGNIRELFNRVQKASILSSNGLITANDIFLDSPLVSAPDMPEPQEGFSIEEHIRNIRIKLFDRALEKAEGNKSKAARMLGITPQAMHKEIKSRTS